MDTQAAPQMSPALQNRRLGKSNIVSPETRISKDSVFGDPQWEMASLVSLPGVKSSQKRWDFRSVPGFPTGFALSLAEYAYARLFKPVLNHGREGTWLTVQRELTVLRGVAQFCQSQGLSGFSELDTVACESYLRFLQIADDKGNVKSDQLIRYAVRIIYRLWSYRDAVTEPIPSMPFGRSFTGMFRRDSKANIENATSVIPKPIYSATMAAALDYVLVFSSTILKAWHELQTVWDNRIAPSGLSLSGSRKRLVLAANDVLRHWNATWRIQDWSTYGDVYVELYQLRTACMLVALAYSGIRVSELLSIEAGCYVSDKCEDGHIRYYINTKIHKHREGGSKDSWVTIGEVVKAIKILEILTERIRRGAKDNRLMITDRANSLFSVHRKFEGKKITELTNDALIFQIHTFRNHCNTALNRPPIPDWTDDNGVTKPWQFNTRQFRRTLAAFIARQPFGVVAGMIQYKHVRVAIFQGYAGTEPEWNKLVEEEKILASVDILDEVALDLSNGQLVGDFGIKLKEEYAAEFRGRAEDYLPSQIAKWLANKHKPLFVGKFNFCFFDKAKAICTRNSSTEGPILNFCQPEECANACVGKRHITKWEAQLKQADELARHPKTSPLQREVLQREAASLRAVVSNFGS